MPPFHAMDRIARRFPRGRSWFRSRAADRFPNWYAAAMAISLPSALPLVVIAALPVMQASQEPAASGKVPGRGDTVVVRGCLAGPSLQSTETAAIDGSSEVTSPVTYQLKGDKKLLKTLRDDLDGRMVKVTGVLKSALPQDNSVGSTKVGRTKIVVGVGTPTTTAGAPDSPPPLPVLEVKSYEGTATSCAK
jgi:hypothetical protein